MRYDKRDFVRRTFPIPAMLAVAPDAQLRKCMVLDISESGARLGIDGAGDLPDEFTIILGPGGRPFRRCRVVWRADTQVAVRFDRNRSSHTNADTLHVVRA
jgi:hypothetical protein